MSKTKFEDTPEDLRPLRQGVDTAGSAWVAPPAGSRFLDSAMRGAPWLLTLVFLVVAIVLYRDRESIRNGQAGELSQQVEKLSAIADRGPALREISDALRKSAAELGGPGPAAAKDDAQKVAESLEKTRKALPDEACLARLEQIVKQAAAAPLGGKPDSGGNPRRRPT